MPRTSGSHPHLAGWGQLRGDRSAQPVSAERARAIARRMRSSHGSRASCTSGTWPRHVIVVTQRSAASRSGHRIPTIGFAHSCVFRAVSFRLNWLALNDSPAHPRSWNRRLTCSRALRSATAPTSTESRPHSGSASTRACCARGGSVEAWQAVDGIHRISEQLGCGGATRLARVFGWRWFELEVQSIAPWLTSNRPSHSLTSARRRLSTLYTRRRPRFSCCTSPAASSTRK
jgi:hypothetical protein